MEKANIGHSQVEKFFNLSIDLLCTIKSDGFFVHANPAFTKTFGYELDELLTKPMMDFIHPDDIPNTLEKLSSIVDGNLLTDFSNRCRHSAGHYLTLSWSAIWDDESQLVCAIARDDTQNIIVKHRLSQIENALKEETILAQTDANGVIEDVNDKFCEISGYTRDEIIGKTHKLINSGHHSKSFFKQMWATIKSGKIWSGVIKNKKKNGDFYFVQSILIPLKDLNGDICNYLAIRQDITSTRLLEAKLNRTLEILNETGELAKIGGWELTIDSDELLWTDETFKILEVPKDDSMRPTLPQGLNLFVPEHQDVIANAVERAIKHGEPYALELKARTYKSKVLWVFTTGKANYKDEKIISISGTIQDIDERKKAEIQYAKERQVSIQNAKLASLGELSASIAHELNNPLGIILGNTDLIQMSEELPFSIQSKVQVIEKSSERIAHIVRSLKKFSRTDNEVQPKHLVPLENIVKESLTLTAPRLKEALIQINFHSQTSASILCNEIEIEQIIINLINNGIDAVVDLPIKWLNIFLFEEGEQLILTITDSGCGIPDEIQEKIFEPFYTSKKPGEGTGLGLSIVKGMLDDHNASIYLDDSSLNTSFVLRFPIVTES